MIERRNIDRWLVIGVALLIIGAMAFLSLHAWNMGQRRLDTADAELERVQQLLRMRLDGMVHELVEDLLAEAEAIQEHDSLRPSDLVLRWRPLLMSHWPIMAVRLGDEHGNEVAFERADEGFRIMMTSEGSKHGPVIMARVSQDPTQGVMDSIWISDDVNDPREQGWFSKALEDARSEPAWSLNITPDTGRSILQLSTLIRSRRPGLPYRIMAIDVDVSRSGWLETKASPLRHYGVLLLDGSGHTLEFPSGSNTFGSPEILDLAATTWTKDRARWPFTVAGGPGEYRALVAPYILNGLTLQTGVLLNMDLLDEGTGPETMMVVVMILLLLLLAFLLGWLWLRKRQDDERLRRQVRRSKTQERKLAKALGEREVLNREVHHRVKNNLQVVSSLLNLQATRLDDGPVKKEFMRGKQRIDTIALVHHKLYGSKDLRNVDLLSFITGLIDALSATHKPASDSISVAVMTGDLHTDQDTAIELGIIVCELLSNSFQHAFPYATGGHVDIEVKNVEGDLYRLVVKDNGRGLVEGHRDGSGKLGLEIVEALAEQLDGSFHTRTDGGVTFEVLFRMRQDRLSQEHP